jgi:TldD protein
MRAKCPILKGICVSDRASSFRPFETSLDQEAALRLLRATLTGAEDGELFLERKRSEALVFDDGRIKTASYDASEGFGLRAVLGEVSAYAHATELSEAALSRASDTARMAIRQSGGIMAAPPQGTNRHLYMPNDPMDGSSFEARIDLLGEIDAYTRALDPRVVQVSVSLAASHQEVEILRPEGQVLRDARPLVRLNLDSVPAPAGVIDVVLGPGWPGILLHEAVGHGLEGDFNRKGQSAFAGLMGQQVAAKGVTVLDDGTLPDRRGSISIDDEGTQSQATPLIEDGILVGYMQDRQSARLMGVAATGNGRRESYAHPPMTRMTNTYMLGGDNAPADILADLKDGIYAVGFGGGQVDITNGKFVFSCTEAYRVQNGQIGAPVKGATLIGDGATALKQIRAIGNDMALDPGMGNCGKAGQWVPVGVGQPTLMIGGLTVGGSA